ncbi:hypothetical protein EDD90_3005 [Streptomyces sp. Ag109_O5-1]|nr:hypothetical protein EDD90_3005 [Streptomyces sp. Ag109_O5-1]
MLLGHSREARARQGLPSRPLARGAAEGSRAAPHDQAVPSGFDARPATTLCSTRPSTGPSPAPSSSSSPGTPTSHSPVATSAPSPGAAGSPLRPRRTDQGPGRGTRDRRERDRRRLRGGRRGGRRGGGSWEQGRDLSSLLREVAPGTAATARCRVEYVHRPRAADATRVIAVGERAPEEERVALAAAHSWSDRVAVKSRSTGSGRARAVGPETVFRRPPAAVDALLVVFAHQPLDGAAGRSDTLTPQPALDPADAIGPAGGGVNSTDLASSCHPARPPPLAQSRSGRQPPRIPPAHRLNPPPFRSPRSGAGQSPPRVAVVVPVARAGAARTDRRGQPCCRWRPFDVLLRRDGDAVLTDFGIAALDDGGFLTTIGELGRLPWVHGTGAGAGSEGRPGLRPVVSGRDPRHGPRRSVPVPRSRPYLS